MRDLVDTIIGDWRANDPWLIRIVCVLLRLGAFCHSRYRTAWGPFRYMWRVLLLFMKVIWEPVRVLLGFDMYFGMKLGQRPHFYHRFHGVVISEYATIGDDVSILHGVTIGLDFGKGKRAPTLGNRVFVGAGAMIIGPINIGDGACIGAGAVVVDDVAACPVSQRTATIA